MKLINIIYGDYNDADILLVPDQVCQNLDEIARSFLLWISETKDHGYWKVADDGHEYLEFGTDEFVKWLRDNYGNLESDEIKIVESNTKYNPQYPFTDF